MKFEVENRAITEAYTTIKKASRELKPELFTKAIEDLVKDTFDGEYRIVQLQGKCNHEEDELYKYDEVLCDIDIQREILGEEVGAPYNISIRSLKTTSRDNAVLNIISIRGNYAIIPHSGWVLGSYDEHEIKSNILYLAFCLNKFFNHK